MPKRRGRAVRAGLVVCALGANLIVWAAPAISGGFASTTAQHAVGTGDWAEVIRPLNGTAQTGTTSVSRSLSAGAAAVYDRSLELANVGTHNLLSASITVTVARTSGTNTTTVNGVYIGCRNGTWSAAGTPVCSGTQVALGTATGSITNAAPRYTATITPTVAMAVNERMPIRLAMTSRARNGTFTFTASVSITRARVRAAQIRTS